MAIIILTTVQRDPTQRSIFTILQVHSPCSGCQPHPSSGVHKTVTTASGTLRLPPSNVAKIRHDRYSVTQTHVSRTHVLCCLIYLLTACLSLGCRRNKSNKILNPNFIFASYYIQVQSHTVVLDSSVNEVKREAVDNAGLL